MLYFESENELMFYNLEAWCIFRGFSYIYDMGVQWLSGRVLDSRQRGSRFKPHRCHCVVLLEQDTFILALIVLVQPRKTCPCLTERLLMGHTESNQTKQNIYGFEFCIIFGLDQRYMILNNY